MAHNTRCLRNISIVVTSAADIEVNPRVEKACQAVAETAPRDALPSGEKTVLSTITTKFALQDMPHGFQRIEGLAFRGGSDDNGHAGGAVVCDLYFGAARAIRLLAILDRKPG
jgi:hypothetical protein